MKQATVILGTNWVQGTVLRGSKPPLLLALSGRLANVTLGEYLESIILTEDRVQTAPVGIDDAKPFGILAFSHLRWDFVWQRPQQFLSRFAETNPVLFIEEPKFDLEDGHEPKLEIVHSGEGVTVGIPHLAQGTQPKEAGVILVSLVTEAMKTVNDEGHFDEPLHWYYSPMMVEWSLGQFPAKGIVYDCMDELSQFRFAPPELIENERQLMDNADIVFTGGYELYEKKRQQHPNAHCFGCGVEYEHFAQAQDANGPIPDDMKEIKKPIIGWFGVIDERVDYDLIREAAAKRPDYSFVLVGPVVKVDPESLPKAPNIHWLGGREYKDLPNYCRAFDICMMCFAINEATEFINPTKALEYLATGKPVISTAVRDVLRQYSDLVDIVRTPGEFVEAIDRLVKDPTRDRIQKGIEKAQASSWEGTVSQMRDLIQEAIESDSSREKAVTVNQVTAL
jgi:glycosyltransferase involved in cell wall biosynthesis